VEASTLSKLAVMSRKRVEPLSLGLWRVLSSWVRARQASEALRSGTEPHWLGGRRPLDLAMADSLTVITCSRTMDMFFGETMMGKEERES